MVVVLVPDEGGEWSVWPIVWGLKKYCIRVKEERNSLHTVQRRKEGRKERRKEERKEGRSDFASVQTESCVIFVFVFETHNRCQVQRQTKFIVAGNCNLTLNIPSLARQRCLPSWGPRRTRGFFVISQLFDAVDYSNYVFWVSETIIQ